MADAVPAMGDAVVRWGILGTGGIASRFVTDLALVPGAVVHAVGSRAEATARAFADRHGIPQAYGSVADLAADDAIDVVYVATPHSAHFAGAWRCLSAGRAVLCEKPITLDRARAIELVELAGDRGVFLMEAMWTRCDPLVRRVVDLIRAGEIGDLTTVQADLGMDGGFPVEHRMRDPALGGGALLDVGIYPVALAHLLLGVPDAIRSWAHLTPEGVDENTGMVFGYASGALAALTCGMVGTTGTRATLTGTRGRVDVAPNFYRPPTATIHRAGADPLVLTEPHVGFGYQTEAAEVQRCLLAGELESPLVPHAATLDVMGILDAVRAQIGVAYP